MALTTTLDVIHYVGIDISKVKIDCWLRPLGKHLCTGNDQEGFKQLHQWLLQWGCSQEDAVICVENTGLYGKNLLLALHRRGWKCAVEKTTVLEKIGPEHHRKDDQFDACLLAEYADRFTDQLNVKKPVTRTVDTLRQLFAERKRLVTQRRAAQTKQTQSAREPHCPDILQQGWQHQIKLYDQQTATLEQQIQQVIKSDEGLYSYFKLLTDIPGVGKVTGWLWLIMFYGQQTLNPKKIASRFGVAPHSRSSGSSIRGKTRSSGHGVSSMRSTLTMAVQSASTHYDKFKNYKQRKLKEGKPWPVVRNNMVNKLIVIICAIWNSGERYDPNHQSRFNRQKKTVGYLQKS